MGKSELDQYKVEPSKEDKDEFVSCIIIDKDGRPLRLKRMMDQELDPGKDDICSGHIKKVHETPIHAVIRELIEEMEMQVQDVVEMYTLGQIETPHTMLKGTTTYMYCVVTNLSVEEINKKIQGVENREIQNATFLESIEELRNQIKDPKSNWRVVYTKQIEKTLCKIEDIIQKRNQQAER